MTVLEWVTATATVAAVAAAAASWRAAVKSNETARELSRVERDRRHAELTPEFAFEFREVNTGAKTAKLAIQLVGPVGLDELDSIVVSFRGDGMARGDADNVFGPVRFEPFLDGGAPNRKESAAKSIRRGEFVLLQVEGTSSHAEGWNDYQWGLAFHSQPVRLRIDCRAKGYAPWFVTCDLPAPPIYEIGDQAYVV